MKTWEIFKPAAVALQEQHPDVFERLDRGTLTAEDHELIGRLLERDRPTMGLLSEVGDQTVQ